jgi:hypothetical protein
VLIVIAMICFLPLSNQTGYYLNDWHPLAGKSNNTSLFSMWSHERIGVGLLFSITYPIIQDDYFLWQLFTILLRLISTIGFYWLLQKIWKENGYFNLTAAIIFLIYPGFLQQPIALTFSNHYIGYNLVIFSILFSVLAIQTNNSRNKIIFIAFAVLFEIGYLFDYEYMLGYELVRFILIWYITKTNNKISFPVIKNTIIKNMPYLISVGAFLLWRIFIFKSTRPTTNMGLLAKKYFANPIDMGLRIVLETLRDFIETVWQSWSVPFFQTASNTDTIPFLISVVLGLSAIFFFILTVRTLKLDKITVQTPEETKPKQAIYTDLIWIGLIATLAALLPVIISDREVKFNWQMDRYTLHATFGVAIFITALVFKWIQIKSRKFFISFLILVAVITHYNNTLAYVRWWDYQNSLYWQLSWRAPDIKDGTQVIPLLPYGNRLQEGVEAWTPINAIYRPEGSDHPAITADVINGENMLEIYFKNKTVKSLRGIQYTNDFSYPLLISYPAGGSCAHIIDGERMELSYYDEEIIYRAAPFSQIQRIDVNASPHIPPANIFGKEPDHGWCYYFQTASLLRQQENWKAASQLGDYVLEQNISPVDQSEWLPFLETYLVLNDTEKADLITAKIKSDTPTLENLCGVWKFEKPHINPDVMNRLCSELPNY